MEGVFNVHPKVFRTALVGVGKAGKPAPGPVRRVGKRDRRRAQEVIRAELLTMGIWFPHTAGVVDILFHPAFPVDIRHNAKIFREKLAVWAAGKLS